MKPYAYLSQLEKLLADLPTEKRQNVLHSYEEYFKAAGAECGEDAAARLGTPEEEAEKILQHYKKEKLDFTSLKRNIVLALAALVVLFLLSVSITALAEKKFKASAAIQNTAEQLTEDASEGA